MSLSFGSLFAGIGGFDIGLEQNGLKCLWQCEINDYAIRVLQKHWPDVPRFRDIRECNPPYVDVICGGFPCQDISIARIGEGISGPKSGLWKEMVRIIRLVRPRYIIVENTPELLNRGFETVLSDLAASGYDAQWACLSSHQFGAEHRRMRLFIFAYSASIGRIAPPFFGCQPGKCQKKTSRKEFISRLIPCRGFERTWAFPDTGTFRIPNGLLNWVDRLRVIGNAVDPRVAEWLGSRLIEFEGNYDPYRN